MNFPSTPSGLLNALIYLDRGYIADIYEIISGEPAATQITRSQGKKAGLSIPVFSAEVSAQETRSFPVSTFGMLQNVLKVLAEEPEINASNFKTEMPSMIGWINGELSVFTATSSVQDSKTGEHRVKATDRFFHIRTAERLDLALITTPEYFSSGLDAFLRMQDTVLEELSIPIASLVRVFAANSHHKQWIAVPLVMVERSDA